MGDYVPRFSPGEDVTFTATAAVTGGQVVEVTGDRSVAATSAASAKVAGVALIDAALGKTTTVSLGGVHQLVASAAIAAGDRVQSAAAGKVATLGATAVNDIGIALTAAAANNDPVTVRLRT